MKIRAITLGDNIKISENNNEYNADFREKLKWISELKNNFTDNGIEVQYIRYAAPAIDVNTDLETNSMYRNINRTLEVLDSLVQDNLLGIYSFAALLCDQQDSLTSTQEKILSLLSSLLKSHPSMFSSVQVASTQGGFSFQAIEKTAKIIQDLSIPNPFTNVQFAMTANVPPNTPFFPSAYHQGLNPKISIALEAADELIHVLEDYHSNRTPLKDIQKQIRKRFENIADEITNVALPFCEQHGFEFVGIDFSPAPYPTQDKSIGTALEKLNLGKFGEIGSVFAVGFLTQALQSINRPYIGFSGFMQPLLEDYTIARRNNEGLIDINKLLLYSTQCGLGLDCV
ncbi:MAG: DUF711 family protein, partial [Promethearchaeota archaeon]